MPPITPFQMGRSKNIPLNIILGILLGFCFVGGLFAAPSAQSVHAQSSANTQSTQNTQNAQSALQHTSPTVDPTCKTAFYSRDGNPFQLCPGPFPKGGNCVWWAWEQWHLLGYDLPLNWGNAADWIVDAERDGFLVGTQPRVGAIAVFPRADGYWAFGTPGHVAFVTSIDSDGSTFSVTYQNYGDVTPFHLGLEYSVPVINAPNYQNGQLRFIYLPIHIDPTRFLSLNGVNASMLNGVAAANSMLDSMGGATSNTGAKGNANAANTAAATTTTASSASRLTLGLPSGSGSAQQEYNADFTGTGVSDLLLYNRQQGSLDVLSLTKARNHLVRNAYDDLNSTDTALDAPLAQRVSLGDTKTPVNSWGSTLDVRIGDFAGTGESDILLYDRTNGKLQLLSLTPQLTIKKHVVLDGWGPNWELSTGRFDGQRSGVFLYNRFADASVPVPVDATDKGGLTLGQWYTSGRTANAVILDFNADFSVRHIQQYTQWHNSWEVYIGRFKSATQDGVFLYDRNIGEARVMDFDDNMLINDYQEFHNLVGNWQVFSGDFNGSGRSQVMLYDPSQGRGGFLVFGPDLSLVQQYNYTGWKPNEVFYVGHFGTDRMNAMLYDPQEGTSTFIVFDNAFKITHLYTVQSWDQHWQILIGAFVNRSSCVTDANCLQDDDILVLNRTTGQMEQYSFTFGRQYQVLDNRSQAFARDGLDDSGAGRLQPIDTTSFKSVASFSTSINGEELY